MNKVIDSHSHWLPDEIISNAHFYHKGWADLEAGLKSMQQAGVDKAVLSYPTSDAYLKLGSMSRTAEVYNTNLAKILRQYPDKFIAAAILPIDDPKGMIDQVKRATEELGFKAISLASSYDGKFLDDEIFLPLYALAQEKKIPIFVHAQITNPIGFERVQDPLLMPVIEFIFDITMSIGKLLMADIFRDYPNLKFIFANFGGAIGFLQHRFDATYQMLRSINFVKDLKGNPTDYLKNIYVDTGGDRVRTNFLLALELFGPRHILWGSDWPAKKDVAGSIEAVKSLQISEDEKAAILGGNIASIMSL